MREWSPPRTDGETLPVAMLVHGITGWSRTWWRLGPALAERGWRAVGVDLRGHGNSPRIDGVATVQTLAADLALTVRSLGIETADALIAHSLGAAVAMELAVAEPRLMQRLVLEDPPGQTRADDLEYQATLEREVLAARTDPQAEIRREIAENPRWHLEDVRQNVEGRAMCNLDGILASLRANAGIRAVELAPALTVPALYLIADAERSVLGARRSELLRSLPPAAGAAEFDSGHTIHRDRFGEYLAAVVDWLRR
jgi:pimeloyl-ACP methyl ester carboxylesterase